MYAIRSYYDAFYDPRPPFLDRFAAGAPRIPVDVHAWWGRVGDAGPTPRLITVAIEDFV